MGESVLLPTATKTKLAKLIRSKGYDIPSIRQAHFDKLSRGTFTLEWTDSSNAFRRAFYSGCAGRPYLQVGEEWIWLTMSEALQFGLVEKVKAKSGGDPSG